MTHQTKISKKRQLQYSLRFLFGTCLVVSTGLALNFSKVNHTISVSSFSPTSAGEAIEIFDASSFDGRPTTELPSLVASATIVGVQVETELTHVVVRIRLIDKIKLMLGPSAVSVDRVPPYDDRLWIPAQ